MAATRHTAAVISTLAPYTSPFAPPIRHLARSPIIPAATKPKIIVQTANKPSYISPEATMKISTRKIVGRGKLTYVCPSPLDETYEVIDITISGALLEIMKTIGKTNQACTGKTDDRAVHSINMVNSIATTPKAPRSGCFMIRSRDSLSRPPNNPSKKSARPSM